MLAVEFACKEIQFRQRKTIRPGGEIPQIVLAPAPAWPFQPIESWPFPHHGDEVGAKDVDAGLRRVDKA